MTRTRPGRRLALAVGTLTALRMPVQGNVGQEDLRASTAFYPLVGLGVGAVPALALLLPLPPLPAAALALALWVAVTGALHVDGWADCCDAAFAPPAADPEATRAKRLRILADPHHGTFGVAGTFLLLLGKWSALVHVPAAAPLVAAAVGRWAMVFALRAFPPARAGGLGATFAGRVPLATATLLLAAILLGVWLAVDVGPWAALVGAGAAVAGAGFLARRFGGVTGDVCGAVGEVAELAVLWALIPWGMG